MPWYGWVFAIPFWATMLWSFVELVLPLMLLVAGWLRWRFFVRAVLLFAASLWAFLCLNDVVPALLRVLDPPDAKSVRDWGSAVGWLALGVGPWIAALAIRFQWRATLWDDTDDSEVRSVPSVSVLGDKVMRARACDLGVDIGTTPMSSTATLSTPLRPRITATANSLVLETHRGVRAIGCVAMGWGLGAAVLAAAALIANWNSTAKIVFLGQGVTLPLLGTILFVVSGRHEFDRAAGVYLKRSLVAPDRQPLTRVRAIQVIRGPVGETADGLRYETMELNLVLDGGARLNVTCLADGEWVQTAGRAVAEFLGVPVLDGGAD